MKPYIIFIPVILLIIALSILSGGVTPEIRPAALSGGILIFIISLLVVSFSSSYSLDNPLILPAVLISAALIVRIAAPASISGKIPLLEIISYSLAASAVIISRPSPRAVVFFLISLTGWGVILVGYGLVQRWSVAGEIGNISAAFVNRNHFCAFIGMIAPLSLSLGLWAPGRLLRRLSGFFFLVIGGGVVLTGSRGGVIAFGVSTIAVLLPYTIRRRWDKRQVICFILAAIGGIIVITVLLLPARGTLSPITETTLSELSVRT